MRLLATLVFVLVAVPALALAKPKVALVPLDNDSGGDIQDAVVEALGGDELALVGPKQVARAADKLGLEGNMSDKELKKLANELEADAVVQASVSNKGSNKVLHFKLFVHGKKQKGFKIEFGSAKSAKFKSALHEKMVAKLGDIGSGDDDSGDKPDKKKKKGAKTASADDDENPLPAAKKKGKASKDDDSGDDKTAAKKKKDKDKDKSADDDSGGDDKTAAKKKKDKDKSADDDSGGDDKVAAKKKSGDDDSGDDKADKKSDGDDSGAGDDDDKPKKKRTAKAGDDDDATADGDVHAKVDLGAASDMHSANRAAVRLDLGVSVTGRSLTFNSRQFTEGLGSPKPYSNAPVPGGRIEGAIYPLALSNPNSAAAGLGFAAMYDKTFSLGLHNALMPTATYNADEFRWNVGARYRLVFGSKATSPSVTLGIDYGHRQFVVTNRPTPDTGIIIDIPDVEYVGITPSVELRVPLAPAVALVAGGGSMLMLRAGSIQNPEQYGQAKVTEVEAMGGLDVIITKRVGLRFTGEFALMGFAFVGNGAMANARDGDPSNIDVGGASDRYIGGAATLVVLY